MSRWLKLELVARKADNPWLPDDLTVRSGIMCGPSVHKLAIDYRTTEMAKGMARALLYRLRLEGLL